MTRRAVITLLGGAAATWPLATGAQQPGMPVIGFLNSESPGPLAQLVSAFHRGLNETGYVEGKNVIIEYRWARGQYDRLREMAADLVRRRVAVIVTTGASPSLLAARSATREIPTVLIAGEPMQDGIVVSFNRPGRNATGVSLFTDALSAKRLELVRELIPNAAVIALLVDPNSRESMIESSEVQEAAQAIGQRIIVSKAGSAAYPGSIEAAMAYPRGESGSDAVRLDFDRRLMLQFRGFPGDLRCWVAGLSRTRRRARFDRDGG